MKIKRLIIILIIFLGYLLANDDLNFADELFKQQDWSNAILIYKKALFFEKDNLQQEKILFKLAQAYYHNLELEKSQNILNDLIESAVSNKKQAQYQLAKQYFEKDNFSLAAIEFKDYYDNYQDQTALYLSAWSYLKQYRYRLAANTFRILANVPSANLSYAANVLSDKSFLAEKLPQKSIKLAQTFSYFFPGAGQVYAKNWKDGAVSFLINALTISLLTNALQNNRSGEALIWLTLESGWYFGGVYAAGNSAAKYNRTIRENYTYRLEEEFQPEKLLQD